MDIRSSNSINIMVPQIGRLSMIQFFSTSSAILLIFLALFLLGCSDSLSETAKRNNAGIEYQRVGEFSDTIGEYSAAILLNPQLAEPYYN